MVFRLPYLAAEDFPADVSAKLNTELAHLHPIIKVDPRPDVGYCCLILGFKL